MPITSICTGCGRTLAVAEEFAGRLARCPQCGTVYTVPSPGSSAAEETPSQPTGLSPLASPIQPEPDPYALPSLDPPSPTPLSGTPANSSAATFTGNTPTLEPLRDSSSQPIGPTGSPPQSVATSYWMKATDGREYGPVDRAMLDRWFYEGRVGNGYLIRVGDFGAWQPAPMFQPAAPGMAVSSGGNPFADAPGGVNPYASGSNPYGAPPYGSSIGRPWPKNDQSGLVLTLGILAWVLCPCGIFGTACGVAAWIMGRQALNDIRAGLADPTKSGMVQTGYYLGMINVILTIVLTALYIGALVIAAIAGNL